MKFEFCNLECEGYYNEKLDDYIINIPSKKLRLSFNKIEEFVNTGNPQIIGLTLYKGEPCKIFEVNQLIYMGCESIVKDKFSKQFKVIKTDYVRNKKQSGSVHSTS